MVHGISDGCLQKCWMLKWKKETIIRLRIIELDYYQIGDQRIEYRFIYPETAEYFKRFSIEDHNIENDSVLTVHTTKEQMEEAAIRRELPVHYSPGVEYDALALGTSSAMIPNGAFLFHSVAFEYRGKAIVFTGPSGIGKTTQYAQWKRLLRDEIKVISGDMPVMSFREDGSIWMMPSPWNGKERLHSNHQAPLGGIIVLEQAMTNTITRIPLIESILPVYSQMCLDRTDKELIRLAFQMEDELLRKIPVWRLSSRGDLDSARLCHEAITGEIYGD